MKKKTKRALLALGLGLAFFYGYNENQCFKAREKRIEIISSKVKSDLRICQISDFHSNVIANLDDLLSNIKDFNPHFIILTGDIIDYASDKKIERSVYFLKNLNSLGIKTYFITGNHEEASPNLDIFLEELAKLGITYLDNEASIFKASDNLINLYGLSYFDGNFDDYKPKDDMLNIILAHSSRLVRDSEVADFDLVFSGHTHGGQVRLPLIGSLLAPGEGILPHFDMGKFTYKNGTIYIDSGLGNTFMPLRFLNPIGYSNITIKKRL